MGLRFKQANVTHPELKTTFKLPILSVKKNPQSTTYTSLGVVTKGIYNINRRDCARSECILTWPGNSDWEGSLVEICTSD